MLNKETVNDFSRYMKKNKNLYSEFATLIKNNISVNNKIINVLDVGCGPGFLLEELNTQLSKVNLYGIDISDHMINISSKLISSKNNNIHLFFSTVNNPCFKSNMMDIITSRFSLCYWKNPVKCFIQLNEILKPDGKIIFEVLNAEFPKYKLFFIKINMFFKNASKKVIKYHIDAYQQAYTIDQIKIILKNAGFKINKIYGGKKDWKYTIIAVKS
jgi:ubiquinone/menaquinone biosynthesis C-methylase UbiE